MKLAYMYATPDVNHSKVTAIKGDPASALALIKATGYSGVELLVGDPTRIDASGLERAVNAEGLDLPAICTGEIFGEGGLSFADPDPFRRAEARGRMKSALELASRFGAMVNVGRLRGRYVEGVAPQQTMNWIAEALLECSSAFPGTPIVIEPVNREYANCLLNSTETLEFVRRIALPSVGIMLDSVHMAVEEEDVAASMRAASAYFWHFHISDSNRLPVGDGDYPIAAYFEALREVEFDRYVTVETFQIPNTQYSIAASFRSLSHYFR